MNDTNILSVTARYVIGGTVISIFLYSLLSGGSYLAIVWLYGVAMAPLTLAFAIAPSVLSAPGAILAHRLDIGWRITSAAISATILTLIVIL